MAYTFNNEGTLETDFKLLLATVLTGETIVFAGELRSSVVYPCAFVHCAQNQEIHFRQGVYEAEMLLTAASYKLDDASGSAVNTLFAKIRQCLQQSGVITTINSLSTYCKYFDIQTEESVTIEDDNCHYRELSVRVNYIPNK